MSCRDCSYNLSNVSVLNYVEGKNVRYLSCFHVPLLEDLELEHHGGDAMLNEALCLFLWRRDRLRHLTALLGVNVDATFHHLNHLELYSSDGENLPDELLVALTLTIMTLRAACPQLKRSVNLRATTSEVITIWRHV